MRLTRRGEMLVNLVILAAAGALGAVILAAWFGLIA